jgi:hypothetical protein
VLTLVVCLVVVGAALAAVIRITLVDDAQPATAPRRRHREPEGEPGAEVPESWLAATGPLRPAGASLLVPALGLTALPWGPSATGGTRAGEPVTGPVAVVAGGPVAPAATTVPVGAGPPNGDSPEPGGATEPEPEPEPVDDTRPLPRVPAEATAALATARPRTAGRAPPDRPVGVTRPVAVADRRPPAVAPRRTTVVVRPGRWRRVRSSLVLLVLLALVGVLLAVVVAATLALLAFGLRSAVA